MNRNGSANAGAQLPSVRKPLLLAIALASTCSGLVAPAALAQDGADAIEEVMVTARRREESLQEVPVSVAVVDAAAIEARSLQSIDDIARFTPGLSFSKAFGRATERPVIRGLGNVLAGVQFGVESGAAYFVDGVYYPGDLQGLNLNDLERVEVIKGPQSALYGRNSYAGAINFVTKSPTEELSGDVRLLFAEDGEQDLRASVSGPLIPGVLGGSLSLRSYEFDGQWDNQVTGNTIGDESTDSISGLLEWTPSERMRIRVRGQYQEDDDGTRPLFLQPATENNCSPGLRSLSSLPLWGVDNNFQYFCGDIQARPIALNDADAVGETVLRDDVPAVGGTFFGNPYARTDGTPFDGVQREINLASALMDYEFDNGYALTLSSAYRKEELKTGSDSDHSAVNFKFSAGTPGEPFENGFFAISGGSKREDYSLELRFDSPQDRDFRWMVGAFYFDQEIDGFNINFGVPNRYETTTSPADEQALTNQAVFGSITYDFSERLTASAEIRYMEEDKTLTDAAFNGDDTWTSTTPRVTVNYQLNEDVMLYASYAEGAKPGGFNGTDGASVSLPVYDQEESGNYELGVKSTMMDGRLIANAAVFFTEVTDIQLTTPIENPSDSSLTSIVTNQGEGEVFGVELELSYYASENLMFGLNYALADTQFTSGCDEFQWTLTSGGGKWTGDPATSADFTGNGDCSIEGNQFPLSSEHQASAFMNFSMPISSGMEFFFNADVSYESEKPVQVHNLAYAPEATIVGARFGLNGENWTLAAFGRNLTDEDAPPMATRWLSLPYLAPNFPTLNTAAFVPGADTSSPRAFFGSLRRERQLGLELIYRF